MVAKTGLACQRICNSAASLLCGCKPDSRRNSEQKSDVRAQRKARQRARHRRHRTTTYAVQVTGSARPQKSNSRFPAEEKHINGKVTQHSIGNGYREREGRKHSYISIICQSIAGIRSARVSVAARDLQNDALPLAASASISTPPKQSTVKMLPAALERDLDDAKLLGQIIDYYHQALLPDKPPSSAGGSWPA
jgi:hypothetical protein